MNLFVFLHDTIVPICICVVLPITLVWMLIRMKRHSDNMRKEIILVALEKNTDIDVEEMMKKLNGPKKLLKEKLIMKLLIGSMFVIFSILIYIAMAVFMYLDNDFPKQMFIVFSFIAVPALAVGLAYLVNYFVGRKLLAKEMEAEEQNLRQS